MAASEIFAYFTLSLGLNPKYVLDDMSTLESGALIDYLYYKDRTSWEQSRFQALCSLSPWSKKELKPQDLIKFAWESPETLVDEKELERLKNKAKYFEQICHKAK